MQRQDGRTRILIAARAAFGEYGYSATTTRYIARRAGVSEPMIFRHFGSKEALFDAAVLTPFTEFIARHLAEWEQREPGSVPALQEAQRLFDHLVALFVEERAIIRAILAVYHFDEVTSALRDRLEVAMREVVALVERRSASEAMARGNAGFDVAVVARMMVGMCFSLITFPGLFATDRIPRGRLVDEMARFTMHGIEFRDRPLKDEETAAAPRPRLPGRRIDDDTWTAVAAHLVTSRGRGRPRADDRAALEGIVDILVSGTPWKKLPTTRHGVSGVTCWRRMREWEQHGVWPHVVDTLRARGIDIPTRQ